MSKPKFKLQRNGRYGLFVPYCFGIEQAVTLLPASGGSAATSYTASFRLLSSESLSVRQILEEMGQRHAQPLLRFYEPSLQVTSETIQGVVALELKKASFKLLQTLFSGGADSVKEKAEGGEITLVAVGSFEFEKDDAFLAFIECSAKERVFGLEFTTGTVEAPEIVWRGELPSAFLQ